MLGVESPEAELAAADLGLAGSPWSATRSGAVATPFGGALHLDQLVTSADIREQICTMIPYRHL